MSTTTPPKPTIREKIKRIVYDFYMPKVKVGAKSKDDKWAVPYMKAMIEWHLQDSEVDEMIDKLVALLSPQTGEGEISEEMEKDFDEKFTGYYDYADWKKVIGKDILAFLRKHLSMQREADRKWVLEEVLRYPNPEEVDGDEDYEDIRDWIDLQRAELRSKLLQKEELPISKK